MTPGPKRVQKHPGLKNTQHYHGEKHSVPFHREISYTAPRVCRCEYVSTLINILVPHRGENLWCFMKSGLGCRIQAIATGIFQM